MFRTVLLGTATALLCCSMASAVPQPGLPGWGIGLGAGPLGSIGGIGVPHLAPQFGLGLGLNSPQFLMGPLPLLHPYLGPTPLPVPTPIGGHWLPPITTSLPIPNPTPSAPGQVLGWPIPDDVLQGPNTDPAAYMPALPDGLTIP